MLTVGLSVESHVTSSRPVILDSWRWAQVDLGGSFLPLLGDRVMTLPGTMCTVTSLFLLHIILVFFFAVSCLGLINIVGTLLGARKTQHKKVIVAWWLVRFSNTRRTPIESFKFFLFEHLFGDWSTFLVYFYCYMSGILLLTSDDASAKVRIKTQSFHCSSKTRSKIHILLVKREYYAVTKCMVVTNDTLLSYL